MAQGSSYFDSVIAKTGKQAVPLPDRDELMAALAFMGEMAQLTLAGTGAALDVELPFDPAFAILINETTGPSVFLGSTLKAAGTGIGIVAATALVAANGFTFTPKVGSTPANLRLGTSLHANLDVLRLVVWGMKQNPLR
jgi:hypothetical protein